MANATESIRMRPRWRLEKWEGPAAQERHDRQETPDEVREWEGNLALNAGLALLADLLIGAAGTPFNNANARMYVGDGTAAAGASQVDLQGANKAEKGMDTGFPTRSGQTVTWKATYGSTEANFAWEEGGVKNAAGTPNGTTIILFNRKVQTLGTKAAGSVWTLTLDVTFQ